MSDHYLEKKWLKLADLNLAAAIKTRMHAISNSTLLEQDGQLIFSIGHQAMDGHLNGILRYSHDLGTENAIEFYNQRLQSLGFGFIIWIRDHADGDLEKLLQNVGLTPLRKPGSAGMVIEHPLVLPDIPGGLEIVKVSTREHVTDFNTVITAAFGISFEICQLAIGRFEQLTKPNVNAFVIREYNQAIAAGITIHEHGVAGIYYIGVIPQARRRGLGDICTRVATNAGFDLGAQAVILQASLSGEPLYKRLGFNTITHYRWFPFTTAIL